MSSLSPRQRVLRAVHRETTDRVPVDLWITSSSEARLRKHFGLSSGEALRERLGIDLRTVFPPYVGPPLEKTADSETDLWGVVRSAVTTARGRYMEVSHHPLACARSADDLDSVPWPNPDWLDYSAFADRLRSDRGRHAIVVCDERTNRTTVLHQAFYLLGMERVLVDLATEPDFLSEVFRRIADFYLALNERIFEAARGLVDFLLIGDDLGTQNGLLLSPAMIRAFILPHLARYARQCHSYGVGVLFHSCGAVRPIVGDLIDAGVDVLNPIQVRARDMDPAALKRDFGDRLSFHGGIDIQETLPNGAPEDVKAETRRLIEILGAGGGYILSTTHNIQDDVPIPNVLALYETAGSLPP
ncbi:MAG: uroporphyrinogen decarboxylase family protein [Planctomycetota bacterium]